MEYTIETSQKKYAWYFLLVISVFSFNNIASAQSFDLESAKSAFKISPTPKNVTTLIEFYQARASWFSFLPQFDKDSTLYFYNNAVLSLENNQPDNALSLTEIYCKILAFDYECHDFVAGDSIGKKAMAEYEKIKDKSKSEVLLYHILYTQAMINIEFGEFQKARDLFTKADDLLKDNQDKRLQAEIFANKARYFIRFSLHRELKLALQNAEKSLSIYNSLNDTVAQNKVSSMIFYIQLLIQLKISANTDTIQRYYTEIEKLLPSINTIDNHLRFYSFFSGRFEIADDLINAKKIIKAGIQFLEHYKLTRINTYESVFLYLAEISLKEGKPAEAFDNYKKGADVAFAINSRASKLDAYDALSSAYEAKGDFKKALEYHKQYLDGKTALVVEMNEKSLKENQLQLDIIEQEKELAENKIQRELLLSATAAAFLLMGVFALIFYRERRNKTKLQAQKTIIEQQSEILKQLDATKTRFFANVSHELRTPLTLMLAPLGTMLKSNTLDNRNFTLTTLVRQHAQNLLRLVNEILDLTKLESGKMKTHEEPTEIYDFLRRLVATFESYAAQRGIKIIFNFDKNLPYVLMLDRPKIEKIFNNLLSNALKFTPNTGTINVNVTHTPSTWQLTVTDTGRGIHPDDLPHVFNRFYQTNQSDTPIEGGTGIGLALANELTQVMNGKISAKSVYGKGATFILELPKREVLGINGKNLSDTSEDNPGTDVENTNVIIENREVPIENKSENENHSRENTILVVEDNPSLRHYLKIILSDHYNVITAENGEEALKLVFSNLLLVDNPVLQTTNNHQLKTDNHQPSTKINLIVSDIMMPIMDGFQLLEKLKSDNNLRSIPVVMLTARAEMRDKLKALTFGVDDYLIKPFEEEELFARIKNLLGNAEKRKIVVNNSLLAESQELESMNNEQRINTAVDSSIDVKYYVSTEADKEWLNELEQMVRQHISDFNFSADALSDLMFLSRSQFYKRIQTLTGLTPLQYIQEIRFNHARTILEQRQMQSVKAVASAIGIHKTQYFSEQFKIRFGKLPSEYLV